MKRRAFSLVELLTVISIITIIMGLVVPAFTSMGRAQSLSTGAATVIDHLALARQTALASNRLVEVRFYKRRENPAFPADPVANPEQFRSVQTFVYDERLVQDAGAKPSMVLTAIPLDSLQNLPTNVIVMEEKEFSTLISPTAGPTSRAWKDEILPGQEGTVKYQAVRFKPTGGTDLPQNGTTDGTNDKWFLTVKLATDPAIGNKPAANYVTAMLDPLSGRVRTFRP